MLFQIKENEDHVRTDNNQRAKSAPDAHIRAGGVNPASDHACNGTNSRPGSQQRSQRMNGSLERGKSTINCINYREEEKMKINNTNPIKFSLPHQLWRTHVLGERLFSSLKETL